MPKKSSKSGSNSLSGRMFGVILYEDDVECVPAQLIFTFPDAFKRDYLSDVTHYAFIRHDCCIHDDGTPKKPHFHVVFKFKNPRNISTVANRFEMPVERIELIHDWTGSVLYLTHQKYPNKYQYSADDIDTNLPKGIWDTSPEQTLSKLVDDVVFAAIAGKRLSVIFKECLTSGSYGYYLRYYKVFSDIYRQEYELARFAPIIEEKEEIADPCPKQEKLLGV